MSFTSLIPARPARPSPTEWAVVAILTAAGLLVRMLLWNLHAVPTVEGIEYIRMARELTGGPAHPTLLHYGFPSLILAGHLFTPDWTRAARGVGLVAGSALIPLTWLVARRFVTRVSLVWLPVAAVAFMPLPVRYSVTTMSEAPYLALLLIGVFLLCRGRSAWAGLAVGLAFTIRPEALAVSAGITLLLLASGTRRHGIRFAVGAAVIVAGYGAVQSVHRGSWTGAEQTLTGSHWWDAEPVVSREATPADVEAALRDPGGLALSRYPGRLASHGAEVLRHGGWVVPIIALGAVAGPGLLMAAGVCQFLGLPFFSMGAHPRFIVPYLPFLWILAAMAVSRLRPGWAVAAGAVVVAAGLAGSAVTGAGGYGSGEDGRYPELVEAGEWLAPFVTAATVVYDRKPYATFYAGADRREIPVAGYEETLDALVRAGGDFLVLNQHVTRVFRPSLLPLVEDKAVVWHEPRLAPVYIDDRYIDGRTLIYRIVREGGPEPLPSEEGMKKRIGVIDHSSNHFVHGILAMRSERWFIAAGEFLYVEQQDPENPAAFNNRAWCLLKAGQLLDQAELDARKAVNLDPDNPEFLDTLVQILRASGDKPRAVELWETRLADARAKRARAATDPAPGSD